MSSEAAMGILRPMAFLLFSKENDHDYIRIYWHCPDRCLFGPVPVFVSQEVAQAAV
jgi:hypothetical protein